MSSSAAFDFFPSLISFPTRLKNHLIFFALEYEYSINIVKIVSSSVVVTE